MGHLKDYNFMSQLADEKHLLLVALIGDLTLLSQVDQIFIVTISKYERSVGLSNLVLMQIIQCMTDR